MKTITGIHGVPRSGTSWLGQMFNASPNVNFKFQPLFSYAFKDFLTLDSSAANVSNFFKLISESDDYFINMNDINIHKDYPEFYKNNELEHLVFKHIRYHYLIEHILKHHQQVKFVLILRNPLAVLSSWKLAPTEFKKEWRFEDEWLYANKKNEGRKEDYFGYNKWKEAMNLFLMLERKYPDRVTTVIYKELINNTVNEMDRLYHFAGIEMSSNVTKFITDSKLNHIDDMNSVFKVKNDDDQWKTILPNNIIKYIYNDLEYTELSLLLS